MSYLKREHHTLFRDWKVTKCAIWQNCYVSAWPNRKPTGSWQFKTDDVSLSKLIGYQISPHKWTFCINLNLRLWFSNRLGILRYSYWVSSLLIITLLIRITSEAIADIIYEKRKSLSRFPWLVSWKFSPHFTNRTLWVVNILIDTSVYC